MIETIKKMDESIMNLQKDISEKQKIIENLNQTKLDLFKVSNICPICYGKGELYKPCNDGDPYHKSSDDWVNCTKCNGSGKFTGK